MSPTGQEGFNVPVHGFYRYANPELLGDGL
jgi:hypothetical protein